VNKPVPRADFGAPIDGFFAKQPAHLRAILDEWHREHPKRCACRPIPPELLAQMPRTSSPPMTSKPRKKVKERKTDEVAPVDPRFAPIDAFASDRDVTYGGKGFGSSGLKVHGKLAAPIRFKLADAIAFGTGAIAKVYRPTQE